MSQSNSKDGKDGEDLNSILDESQRADVTLLVANCTEAMRAILIHNFDAEAGLDKSLLPNNQSDEEKFMTTDPSSADVQAYDNERKLKEECEKDIASSATQKLKENALHAYEEWREQVMMRVGEVVNTKSTAREQLDNETSPMSPKPKAPITSGKITDAPDRNPNLKFKDLFPPTKTPLTKLPMDRRTLILHAILLLLISLEHYNGYSRILMLNLTSSLKLSLRTFEQDEYTTAKGLLESAKELSANEESAEKQQKNREDRRWKVGLATAAGAAILGVSGGLAAPLVASGVGSIMGGLGLGATAAAGYLGSVAGSTLLVGGLFGAYGGRMTGQMMDKYAREVEDFEFLPVHSDKKTSEDEEQGAQEASEHDHKLRVTICISGWLTDKSEITKPWRVLGAGAEVFGLKWELEALLNLGHAMDGMLQSAAWGYAQKELIKRTIFADLMSALWPIGLLKVARVLDNPFSVAKARADKAGEVLADALINKAQGERPVTLIGYSLGARVIYTCLKTLAERKAFGLIENAVLIGVPAPSDMPHWRILRTAVSGRLINVYSQNDYLLGFMYRTSALQYGVAGLQPIRGLAGIENVDVSEDIDGHTRYRFLVGGILKKIGFEDIDVEAINEEREALEKMLKEEKKNSLQAQRKRLMRRESYKDSKVDEDEEAEEEATDMENQVKDKTQKSLMARVIEWWYTPRTTNKKDADQAGKSIEKSVKDPKDNQASGQSYASYIASVLPSMPGGSSPAASKTEAATKEVSRTAENATTAASGYMKAAQDYLPSVPSFGGKAQPKKPETATEKATETAKQAASGAQKGVEGAAGITKDVVQPTVNNVLNPKDNPAVKAANDNLGKAPVVTQVSENVPGAKKAADVTSATGGTTVQNTAQTASGALNAAGSKASDAGSGAKDAASSTASKGADVGLGISNAVTDNAGKASKAVSSSGGGKAVSFSEGAVDSISAGAGKATKAGQDAANTVTTASGQSTGAVSTSANKVADVGKGAFNYVSSSFSESAEGAQKAPKAAVSTTDEAASTGKEVAASSAGKMSDASQPATKTAASGIGALAGAGKSLVGRSDSQPKATPQKAVKAATEASSTPQQQSKPQQQSSQSYLSMASSYIPSLGGSKQTSSANADTNANVKADTAAASETPKRAPPKLAKRTSNPPTPSVQPKTADTPKSIPKLNPKTERKQSATPQTASSPPPKLPRTASNSSGVKSPPKLPRTPSSSAASGVKSPPRKLGPRGSVSQETKSPATSIEKLASGVKSPPKLPKLDKTASDAGKQVGQGAEAAKKQTQSWTGAATGAATNAVSGLGGLAGRMGGFGGGK